MSSKDAHLNISPLRSLQGIPQVRSFVTTFTFPLMKWSCSPQENHEKRERAEQKIREEQAIQKQRDADIESLKKRVQELEHIKDTMEQHVSEYHMYQVRCAGLSRMVSRVLDARPEACNNLYFVFLYFEFSFLPLA